MSNDEIKFIVPFEWIYRDPNLMAKMAAKMSVKIVRVRYLLPLELFECVAKRRIDERHREPDPSGRAGYSRQSWRNRLRYWLRGL